MRPVPTDVAIESPPQAPAPPATGAARPAGRPPIARSNRRLHPLALALGGCLAIAALTLLLPSTPAYDPWAWIGWGRDVLQLDLNTINGPSWKPLPVVFTTLFAPFGAAAPWLWLVVARAGGLLSVVMAFRVARRLVGGRAGWVAGGIAAVGLALDKGYWFDVALGYSEGILVAVVLGAVEAHLRGHTRAAIRLAFCAALLRPETWPFIGAYGVWVWRRDPARRRELAILAVAVPALWFLPELIASGDPLRAQKRAKHVVGNAPGLAADPVLEVLKRYFAMVLAPLTAGMGIAIAFAAAEFARRRRQRRLLILAAATLTWLALVVAMTQSGYSGNVRYIFGPAALACVLGGVGWALLGRALAERLSGRRRTVAVAALVLAVLGATYPFAKARFERIGRDSTELGYEAHLGRNLYRAVDRAGGAARLRACGPAVTGDYQVPALAWHLDREIDDIQTVPQPTGSVFRAAATIGVPAMPALPAGFPTVARAGAWQVLARCAGGGNP